MLHPMFGIGGSEILVILIVALLFLGPDKLPDAAKTISKGIRDLKKQSRALQNQIENDERIGGAIRDLKSALRGEDPPPAPKPRPRIEAEPTEAAVEDTKPVEAAVEAKQLEEAKPSVTLPPVAGEADPDFKDEASVEEIGSLIKPAGGTVAKTLPPPKRTPPPMPIAKADPTPIPKLPKPEKHG
jgi:sec-independent protein translocase protein TatB